MFTVDWFSEHVPNWDRVLSSRLKPASKCLFVGVHEGRAPQWLLQNIAPKAHLTVVDAFRYTDCVYYKGESTRVPPVRKTFDRAMESVGRSVADAKTGRPAASAKTVAVIADLPALKCPGDTFDFAYIDAQNSKQALDACVRVLPMVKCGGTIVITNNVQGRLHDSACPRRGIQGFLDAFVTDIKVLHEGFHTFIERRKTPIALPHPCRYEIYDGQESFAPPKCKRSSRKK